MAVGEELAGTKEAQSGVGVTASLEEILGHATRHAAVLPRRRQSTTYRRTHLGT